VSHKIFAQNPAPTALTVGSRSQTATVASRRRCAIVVVAMEFCMNDHIYEGDGTFQRRLNNGQCPRCRCTIELKREWAHKVEYECCACKLKIIDVKGEIE
jgi:hypothetical protein